MRQACNATCCTSADESDGGDFFYNQDEVLNGVGAENRAALLDRYDAMLQGTEEHDLEEVCLPCTLQPVFLHKFESHCIFACLEECKQLAGKE